VCGREHDSTLQGRQFSIFLSQTFLFPTSFPRWLLATAARIWQVQGFVID
jgi:hypothetical protein